MTRNPMWIALALLVMPGCSEEAGESSAAGGGDAGDSANACDGCGDVIADAPDVFDPAENQALIESVGSTETVLVPGLVSDVHVIRTEGGVPHVYASNRLDLARITGFVQARDRYLMMDLARRMGRGRVSSLLGADALEIDRESRGTGIAFVAQRIHEGLSEDQLAIFTAFVQGVNAYIDSAKAGIHAPPSELVLAGPLLGAENPADLMAPWEPEDVTGALAFILYEASYETGDVGHANALAGVAGAFEGDPHEALRAAGLQKDILGDVAPIAATVSAALTGVVGETPEETPEESVDDGARAASTRGPIHRGLLQRAAKRLENLHTQRRRGDEDVYGSNAWAVSGESTLDGSALMAGDGHLSLAVPTLLFQIGMDTSALGNGDTHQLGMLIPGFPLMNIGTNGRVAWSQTQLMGDVTDWYRESIQLDESGRPNAVLSHDEWVPLTEVAEKYEIADIPIMGSVGGEQTWSRWVTPGGRWITAIEGHPPADGVDLLEGESVISMLGSLIIPGNQDDPESKVVDAISFDYAGLDSAHIVDVLDGFGHSDDVQEFQEWTRGLISYSQNFAVADSSGDILFSAYQTVPCRGYLPRDESGHWEDGADPRALLDGNLHSGFTIAVGDDRKVIEDSPNAEECIIPFDATSQAINPPSGFVLTANNDPGGTSLDGTLWDDEWYYGGPWDIGYRGDTIERGLEAVMGSATVADMSALQGEHTSRLGEDITGHVLAAIELAMDLEQAGDFVPAPTGLVALLRSEHVEVHSRLKDWLENGCPASSGVQTFYHDVHEGEVDDAVATMIFNAFYPRLLKNVFDDEGIPSVWLPSGSKGRVRLLHRMLNARGKPEAGLASHHAVTAESIFFDDRSTPDETETSEELILRSLNEAMDFLAGPSAGPGEGGFATAEMDAWIWGLRHQVKFESLLLDFLPADDFGVLAAPFSITTSTLPLADDLQSGDPRKGLKWFPRPGDNWGVDAGNPGFSGTSFTHGSGPVMRMVVSLKGDEVGGVNILPGGQSALTDSEHFSDQAALWLANDTWPLRFHLPEVVAGAIGRELYTPARDLR
jgi:penicillin amidase